MRLGDADRRPPSGPAGARRPLRDGWDVATVVVEFEVLDQGQAAEVAERLFATEDVLTVRVGGSGERSVYRVDVPREDPRARVLAAEPARDVAATLGIAVAFVRIGITPDGLGDPEGEPPPADAVPWAARRGHAEDERRADRAAATRGEA